MRPSVNVRPSALRNGRCLAVKQRRKTTPRRNHRLNLESRSQTATAHTLSTQC